MATVLQIFPYLGIFTANSAWWESLGIDEIASEGRRRQQRQGIKVNMAIVLCSL